MSFTTKVWKNNESGGTKLNAAGIIDLEKRVTDYVDNGLFFNVKGRAYGATGDGSTDDSSAIQSAITAASAAGGGVVYFPAATYIIGTKLTHKSNVRLLGAGWTASILKAKSTLATAVIEAENYGTTGIANASIEHLGVDGDKANTEALAGILMRGRNVYFNKVLVRKCDSHGFQLKIGESELEAAGLDLYMQSCRAIDCEGKGFLLEAHDTTLMDCQAIQCKEAGFWWTVNGYMYGCHSWCYDSTLETATKTGYRLSGSQHCFNCIAEGATERQVEITGNVIGWHGGEVFNGASKPNAALFEINGGTSARIMDPWLHEFGTGGAFKFTTNGESSVIRARCFDTGANEVTTGTPSESISWDLALGGSTKIGKAAYTSRPQYSFVTNAGTDAPNKSLFFESSGRLKLKDANGTSREFQLAAEETTASANTISVSSRGSLNKISGTTEVKKVNATFAGHKVTLLFTSTAKIVDGENLKLAGNFEGAANRTITLVCDGTDWYEIGRSTN